MSAKVDLGALGKEAEKEGLVSGGPFKPQEGANRIRLVAGPLKQPETYTDKKTGETTQRMRWLWYVIDRRDGQIKPYFMPHSLFKLVRDLQTNEDYTFEEIPVPFDVTITAIGAGTRNVEYSLTPSPKSIPLSADEQSALDAKQPLEAYQQQVNDKHGQPFDPETVGNEAPF